MTVVPIMQPQNFRSLHEKAALRGAERLVSVCGRLRRGERVAVIYDRTTKGIAQLIADVARRSGGDVAMVETPVASMHGEEPSAAAAAAMRSAELIFALRARSMAHTQARIAADGARYLSLPGYSMELLTHPSLEVDFVGLEPVARRLAHALTGGRMLTIETPAGTRLTLDIGGRTANCCPGFVTAPGDLGSPPDIEVNICPVEDRSQGIAVIDGSIAHPDFGLIREPLAFTIEQGRITHIDAPSALSDSLSQLFGSAEDERALILGECGFGMNPACELNGTMLMDEGAAGTLHLGFGSNITIGGQNDIPFHLDCVMRWPTVRLDGRVMITAGEIDSWV